MVEPYIQIQIIPIYIIVILQIISPIPRVVRFIWIEFQQLLENPLLIPTLYRVMLVVQFIIKMMKTIMFKLFITVSHPILLH